MRKFLITVLLMAGCQALAIAAPANNAVPPCDDRANTGKPPCGSDADSVITPPPLPNEDESVITPPEMPGDGMPGPGDKRDPGLPAPVEPAMP